MLYFDELQGTKKTELFESKNSNSGEMMDIIRTPPPPIPVFIPATKRKKSESTGTVLIGRVIYLFSLWEKYILSNVMCMPESYDILHTPYARDQVAWKKKQPTVSEIFASMKIVLFVSGGSTLRVQCTPFTERAVT